jgi:hypothetical protein
VTLIKTDRTRIEKYEKCPRLRYWSTEHDGIGLEPSDERGLKLDARIGSGVHDGIEFGIKNAGDLSKGAPNLAALAAGFGAGKFEKDIADDGIVVKGLPEQQQVEVVEGRNIVTALTYAWVRTRLPDLLRDGDILAVEQEMDVDFAVGDDTVLLMTRPDIIWRRKSDGSVFIRNLKTVREPRTQWREQWALDMQTLTEPLAVDKWMQEGDSGDMLSTCSGVIIDGLVTGSVLDYPRGSGKFYHNTPLLYAWVKKGDAPFSHDEWYARYEWHCTAPHKMGNGKLCPGDKDHKLAGARKVPTTEYPGGLLAWVDHLLEEDLSVVENQIIELPPIMRAPYAIERWKRQVLPREVRIHEKSFEVAALTTLEGGMAPDAALDAKFPMYTVYDLVNAPFTTAVTVAQQPTLTQPTTGREDRTTHRRNHAFSNYALSSRTHQTPQTHP